MKTESPMHQLNSDRTIPCKGSLVQSQDWLPRPENRYHPDQKEWLEERNLYTGRMVVDVAYLPENLKFL